MQTLILAEPGRFTLTSTEAPADPPPGYAVVRVRRIGVCGTDLHAFRGRQPFFEYPRILGHELGAEVVKVGPGSDSDLQPGDRCAVEPYMNCGTCIACRQGNTNACTTLNVIGVHSDGGMREYITVPVHKLHRSMNMTFDQLALVETLGIGAHAVRRAQLREGEWVLVIGAGPIGLTVMQFALLAGAQVIALDLEQKRLEFCQAQLGVQHVVQAGDDALEQVRQLTGGEMPTAVFDATGSEHSMNNAFNYVAQCGKLVFVGLFKGHVTFHDPEFHRRELTLFASRNATSGDLQNVIAQIEAGKIDTTSWITHRAPLAEAGNHFDSWTQRDTGVIKAVISVGD